ncbi:uncharacterized protein LOC111333511 [Stylophora pistillata]|uniref:uncharacterized protein LOC111333511 n=1 Tax=Stylophora pistillata TaxID=50429 RepID=UPI000C04CD8F|nr:uncharacterized protein LOC111333511 [Stylophora pistillata]
MANCPAMQVDEDSPAVPMSSREAEAVHEYGKTYARKYSDFRDDQATVWTSMYEKNLGRKVSRLPPWEVSETGRKESGERHFGDPTKKDFASVMLERAAEAGALSHKTHFETAEHRRERRKVKKARSESESSKEGGEGKKDKERNARTSSLCEYDDVNAENTTGKE